jgi:hypothetical protein
MPMEIAVQNIDACAHDEQQYCDMRQTTKKDGGDSGHEEAGRWGCEGARCDNRPSGHNGITDK